MSILQPFHLVQKFSLFFFLLWFCLLGHRCATVLLGLFEIIRNRGLIWIIYESHQRFFVDLYANGRKLCLCFVIEISQHTCYSSEGLLLHASFVSSDANSLTCRRLSWSFLGKCEHLFRIKIRILIIKTITTVIINLMTFLS